MQTNEAIEPAGSPVSGVIPESVGVCDDTVAADRRLPATSKASAPTEPASSPGRRNPASTVLAKLLSVIRGDKYLVGAYPPDWHSATALRDGDDAVGQNHDGEAGAVQSAVAPESSPAGRGAPAASQTKER
jgi:hypothetical protein